jgi:hypothetical protein
LLQSFLGNMAEWRMAKIVGEACCLTDIWINATKTI